MWTCRARGADERHDHDDRQPQQIQPRPLDLAPHIGEVGVAQEPHKQTRGEQRDERGAMFHGRVTGVALRTPTIYQGLRT